MVRDLKMRIKVPSTGEDRALVGVEINLNDKLRIGIFCTHLDHLSEDVRFEQLKSIEASINQFYCNETGKLFILAGDFNSLKRSDYSEQQWQHIQKKRATVGLEPPQSTVTDYLITQGMLDCEPLKGSDNCRKLSNELDEVSNNINQEENSTKVVSESESDSEEEVENEKSWEKEKFVYTSLKGKTRTDYIWLSPHLGQIILSNNSDNHNNNIKSEGVFGKKPYSRTLFSDASDHLPVVFQLQIN